MIPDLTPGARVHLKSMYELAELYPRDLVAAEAVFTLALIIDRAEGRISDDDRASLLAIGSTMVGACDVELNAMAQTIISIHDARKK